MLPSPETTEDQKEINKFAERSKIAEILKPQPELDQAGFKRQIYTHGDITFSFRGREELPEFQTMKTSPTELLGSQPIHVDQDDYQKYVSNVQGAEATTAAPNNKHYLVTKDIQGVLELAIKLGASDTTLGKMPKETRVGTYSEESLALIDKLIAANCIEDNGVWGNKLTGGDSEAVVVLALLGNAEANKYLNAKLEQMEGLDATRDEKSVDDKSPIDFDKKVCVHATNYMPTKNSDGSYEVQTTGDATGYKHVRNTIHVALNFKVASHMMGNWGQTPYVLLSPMRQMMDANGTPKSAQERDTWWTRNPGETLNFPNPVMVTPGETPFNMLYVVGEKSAVFKGENYTVDDWLKVEKLSKTNIRLRDCLRSVLFADYSDEPEILTSINSDWDIEELAKTLVNKYISNKSLVKEGEDSSFSDTLRFGLNLQENIEALEQDFKVPGKVSVTERVTNVLEKAGARTAFKGKSEGFNSSLEKLSSFIAKKIESEMYAKISYLTTAAAIRIMGFKPEMEENWPSRHNDSPYALFTNRHYRPINQAREVIGEDDDGSEIRGKFNWTKYDPYWTVLPEIDSKTRRVMYASGAFNSRE
jgi:hypothetical protein